MKRLQTTSGSQVLSNSIGVSFIHSSIHRDLDGPWNKMKASSVPSSHQIRQVFLETGLKICYSSTQFVSLDLIPDGSGRWLLSGWHRAYASLIMGWSYIMISLSNDFERSLWIKWIKCSRETFKSKRTLDGNLSIFNRGEFHFPYWRHYSKYTMSTSRRSGRVV